MRLSSSKKAMLVGVSGTALQWYDFAVFGYLAPIIAATYFPRDNSIAALLQVFGVFAVGYLLAPMGAMFFGYIGDRYGRKRALTFSILAMAIPTAVMGILPGFNTIGLAAPVLITLLRVMQGFVASSEFTGSAVFLVEHAKPGQKAFYGALTSAAYSIGVLLAGLTTTLLTASFMPSFAWRFAFMLALVAGAVIFYLRRQVSETPVYQTIEDKDKPKQPFLMALKTVPYAVVGVVGLAWFVGVITFGTYVFTGSYLHTYFNFPLSMATLIVTAGLFVDALCEPFMAMWADRIGHVRMLMIGMGLILALSFPVFCLLASGQFVCVMLGMIIMSLVIATAFSPINAYMIGLFPEVCRYSGFGVSFHIGISLFGSTSPLALMWLVNHTGYLMAPAYYYMFVAFIGFGALLICESGRRKTAFLHTAHAPEISLGQE